MLRFIFPIILWTITVAQEENGIPCQKPYIENGQYTISGGLAKFSCNPGYVLNGSRISQCHYIGWYPHPPVCQEFACGSPPETKYGQYLPKKDSYKIGENVTYICFKNYMIYGDETVTCTAQGWSSLPSCEKTKCPPEKPGRMVENQVSGPRRLGSCNLPEESQRRHDGSKNSIWVSSELKCPGPGWIPQAA